MESAEEIEAELEALITAQVQETQHTQDQLTNEERQLLLSRGDLVGKALAFPTSLTEEERNQILKRPLPDILAAKALADIKSLSQAELDLIINGFHLKKGPFMCYPGPPGRSEALALLMLADEKEAYATAIRYKIDQLQEDSQKNEATYLENKKRRYKEAKEEDAAHSKMQQEKGTLQRKINQLKLRTDIDKEDVVHPALGFRRNTPSGVYTPSPEGPWSADRFYYLEARPKLKEKYPDLDTKRLCSDAEWQTTPIVTVKIQVAKEDCPNNIFIDAELVLANYNEVVVLIDSDSSALQFKRAPMELFLSERVLSVPDCCHCEKSPIGRLPQLPSIEITDQNHHSDESARKSDHLTRKVKGGRSVVEDAEFLRLGSRAPLLSTLQSTLGDGTTQLLCELKDEYCSLHELCLCCTNYFAQVQLTRDPSAVLLTPSSQYRLHESLNGLRKSVRGGSHFCSLVLYNLDRLGILANNRDEKISGVGVYFFYSCFQGRGRERVTFPHEKSNSTPKFESPTIYVSLHPTGEVLETFIKPEVTPQGYIQFTSAASSESENHPSSVPYKALRRFVTSSSKHMKWARGWLKQCTTKHHDCNRSEPAFSPSRLLYVGGTTLCLFLMKGGKKRHKLLSQPLLRRCNGHSHVERKDTLAFLSWHRHHRAATLIPRRHPSHTPAGHRLFWIDSLCIIQDSVDDWDAESAVMGKIYENSYCTIALVEAKNPHEGCFVQRDPRNCNPVRIKRLPDVELLLRPPMPKYFGNLDDNLTSYVVWLANLPSRGWVLQETLLSLRTLYFGRGLFWICRHGQASELDPAGRGMVPQGISYGGISEAIFPHSHKGRNLGSKQRRRGTTQLQSTGTDILSLFRGQPSGGNAPGCAEYEALQELVPSGPAAGMSLDYQFHQSWMRLLGTYTGPNLTMEKDRLPALSGIEPILPFDLVWTVTTDKKDLKSRSAENYTPTWSWASVDGGVGSNLIAMDESARKKTAILIKIISAKTKCHLSDVSCTGQVFEGELVVEGMVINSWCKEEENLLEKLPPADEEGGNIGRLTPDSKPSGINSSTIFVLLVILTPENTYHKEENLVIHGLRLAEKDGYFERIGYYSCSSKSGESLQMSKYTNSVKQIIIR
ncbi:hypothetical protein B7463_g9751, partial [Scytalidium lignicola]